MREKRRKDCPNEGKSVLSENITSAQSEEREKRIGERRLSRGEGVYRPN